MGLAVAVSTTGQLRMLVSKCHASQHDPDLTQGLDPGAPAL